MRDPRHTAIHEAGHVVAAIRLDIDQDEVTIVPDGSIAGAATGEGIRHVWSMEEAEPMAEVFCAGYAALIAAGFDEAIATQGCGSDFESVELLIEQWDLAGGIEEWKARAVTLMSAPENKHAVQLIADYLLKHKTLDADYVRVIMQLADGECTEAEFRQCLQFRDGAFE